VLVTGGAGYIGSVLVAKLVQNGFDVRALDSLMFGGGESLLSVYGNPRLEFIRGDVRDAMTLNRCLNGVDAVAHLAAIVGEPLCNQIPDVARQVNWEATRRLVDLCREKGVSRLIFASTCSNYGVGDPNGWATEESPTNPVSLYAETKVNCENYIISKADTRFHPCVLRFATAFGLSPRMRFDLLVQEMIRDAAVKKKLAVYGPQFWRPFVHVADATEACLLCLKAPDEKLSRIVFNVGGDSENYQKLKLAQLIAKYFPETEIVTLEKVKDPRSYRVSFQRIQTTLGYGISKTVGDGVREIKDALEKGVIVDPFDRKYGNVFYDVEKLAAREGGRQKQ